jgi:hypothetical protein
MFDWQRLAPTRCYLCGGEGADTREHVIPKALYTKPAPSNLIVLPAHFACNNGMSKDEERVVYAWAACRPGAPLVDPLYEKALRALLRPQAAGLRASFLENVLPLDESGGHVLQIPGLSVPYVLAKIVKGLLYRETGHVLDLQSKWWMGEVQLDIMVEWAEGRLIQTPGDRVTAKYLHDDGFQRGAWVLGMADLRVYGVMVFGKDVVVPPSRIDCVTLPWPPARRGT